jgi:response regulator RpfG family c-di-GMP phosphodiesterase
MPKRKAKILIVDDAQINRIILCELLRDQYQILEAEDGKKALEIMKEDKMIDLVLLDIVMPNMDGYQVLEKMKEQRYLEYLPVIIISSEGNTTSMEKAYELGATDYIRRPFESYIIKTL